MENKKKFAEFMTGLSEIFDKEITPTLRKIYWETLKPFSDEECKKVFNKIISTCKFWPKPADFIEVLQSSEEDIATLAWLKVDKAVRYIGPDASIQFNDPIIHSTIEAMGGWEKLGDATERDWKWVRKEFENLYSIMSRKDNHPERLIGRVERYNIAHGYVKFIPRTVKIGLPGRLRVVEKQKKTNERRD